MSNIGFPSYHATYLLTHLFHQAVEAETTYKGNVAEANNRQKELERTKVC